MPITHNPSEYDYYEFQRILEYRKNNPIEAQIKLYNYINKYPKDYIAYPFYASALIITEQYEEAKKIIDYSEILLSKVKDKNKKIQLYESTVLAKFKYLYYQGQYEELYQLCIQNYDLIKTKNLISLYLSCLKKLNLPIGEIDDNMYLLNQAADYSEDRFYENLKKFLDTECDDIEKNTIRIFSSTFPHKQIIEEIKKIIPSKERICPGFYEDIYTFKYDECGRVNNKSVDYFKIVCFHDTQEIITMVPIDNPGNLPIIDLNYLQQKKPVVKILSQIDKFNRRYKK